MLLSQMNLPIIKEASLFFDRQKTDAECLLNNTEIIAQCTGAELIISDPGHIGAVLLADLLDVPRVNFHTTWMMLGPLYGIPSSLSYAPQPLSRLTNKMTFLQRVKNVVIWAMFQAVFFAYSSYFDEFKRTRNIKPERSLHDSLAAAELVLVQTDFALEYARPIPPGCSILLTTVRSLLYIL